MTILGPCRPASDMLGRAVPLCLPLAFPIGISLRIADGILGAAGRAASELT